MIVYEWVGLLLACEGNDLNTTFDVYRTCFYDPVKRDRRDKHEQLARL